MPFPALAGLSIAGKLKKLLPYIAIAAGVALILTLAYCQGKSAGKNEVVVEQLEENIETLEDKGKADTAAGDERVADTQTLNTQAEELEDARTNPADDATTRRARRLCARLRQSGGDTANNPTCCRFEGAAGTCRPTGGVPD